MKIKRLTRAVVLTLTDAEVGDLFGVLGRLESHGRLLSKRELALALKLAGLSEAIVGHRSLSSITDEHRADPVYEAAARATRGIWQTVRV